MPLNRYIYVYIFPKEHKYNMKSSNSYLQEISIVSSETPEKY